MKASIEAPMGLNFGETFSFVASPKVGGSWLKFQAWQQGMLVYSDVRGMEAGQYGYGVPFTCGPSMRWTSGAARGVGQVGHMDSRGRWVSDAEAQFEIGA